MFIRFIIVGGLGFLIDLFLTYLLISIDLPNWVARIPAIAIAILFTWSSNRYFTYKIKSNITSKETIRYALVAILLALVNYLIYLFLIITGLLPLFAVTIATAIQAIISYYLYPQIVFKEY